MKRDLKGRIPAIRHLQMLLLTLSMAALVYEFIGLYAALKSLLVYLPLWAVFEFLHWTEMRESMSCKVCDFDPMLYQRDWKRARIRVEQKMSKVHNDLESEIKARIERVKSARTKSVEATAGANAEALQATSEIKASAPPPAPGSIAKSLESLD